MLLKKTEYNTLKTKVDDIDLSKYAQKTKYDTEVGDLKLKIPKISGLLQTSVFNSKITEVENKIPDISNLATKTKVNAVENKIPDIKNLVSKTELTAVKNKIPHVNGSVKKTDYATEITKIKNDYVTYTALTSRLNDLRQKSHFDSELKKVDDKANKNRHFIL